MAEPTQELLYSQSAREEIKRGVDILANAVKLTLGPEGRNVILKKGNYQILTKDGVTVARSINLKNKYQSVGAEALKEAAGKTNEQGGDGTTLTTILVQSMVEQGFSALNSGVSPISLGRGIKKAVQFVNDYLDKFSSPIKGYEQIKSIASISANEEEMGTHIANLFHKLGVEGVLVVEESKSLGYEEEYVEGMRWDKGFISPYMQTDLVRRRAEIDDCYIMLTDIPIEDGEPIYAMLLELSKQLHSKRVMVVAQDVLNQGLHALVVNNQNVFFNNQQGKFVTLGIRAPYSGPSQLEALEDMAALTGATVISKEKGMNLPKKDEVFDVKLLGRAKKVISSARDTVIIDGQGKKAEIKKRIAKIREELKKEDRDWEVQKLKERLGRLTGGVAILRFGAENESISKEMKYRIEDSINATRNALEEGIVAGGEVALLRASKELSKLQLEGDEALGVNIVRQALVQPIKVLANNAGYSGNEIAKKVLENKDKNFGFDAAKGEYGDMIEKGIIDPKKVVATAVKNASATTNILLTTEAIVTDEDIEKKPSRETIIDRGNE